MTANISADKGSLTAVWLHNNAENNGFAQQINRVPSSIAGADPHTSWVLYSRVWTPSEEKYVDQAIKKIVKDNPDASGDIPFKELKSILNVSHTSTSIAHQGPTEESNSTAKKQVKTTKGNRKPRKTTVQDEDSEGKSDIAKIDEGENPS
ncbi:hypothetical protein PTTG_27286 [Puccinia triticina 1-1 BBBD Race 1]|uniref:Uncharacterized protein n=1 Tax=Puccinia triticina (isolate 1-1 / race 1 (BBBD)) TaxID=630390 RepID=A0A180GMJ2_PUCT1|nr:hypothetical protein PTTG_27286 [Puccinia triticina 1-1 BBBD Race 1]